MPEKKKETEKERSGGGEEKALNHGLEENICAEDFSKEGLSPKVVEQVAFLLI